MELVAVILIRLAHDWQAVLFSGSQEAMQVIELASRREGRTATWLADQCPS
jgi:hypothetical protein